MILLRTSKCISFLFVLLFLVIVVRQQVASFTIATGNLSILYKKATRSLFDGLTLSFVSPNSGESNGDDDSIVMRERLKREILQLGASYDRGFGASPRARTKMENILNRLEAYNPESNASRCIDGTPKTITTTSISPLQGNWRMVWTTASDVLLLGGNPFVAVGAIYQFITPPIVTNVIDFFPRIQTLFPSSSSSSLLSIPNSLARAKVTTRASSRINYPNRIGLNFERVEISGQELLGQDVSKLFPTPLGFDLPKINVPEDVGYFDVTYLDDELLVIRQNAPGGCFVLLQVDSDDTEP